MLYTSSLKVGDKMAERDEFGIIYNNDFKAWYIVYRLKNTKDFKIDTKIEIRPDKWENHCITDDFIERIKQVAQTGYTFNPYIQIAWFNEIDWF